MKHIKRFNESSYQYRFPDECDNFIDAIHDFVPFTEYLLDIDKYRKSYIMDNGLRDIYDMIQWIATYTALNSTMLSGRARFGATRSMVENLRDWSQKVLSDRESSKQKIDDFFRSKSEENHWFHTITDRIKSDMMRRLIKNIKEVSGSPRHTKKEEIDEIIEYDIIEDAPFNMEISYSSIGYIGPDIYIGDASFDTFHTQDGFSMTARYYYELKCLESAMDEFGYDGLRRTISQYQNRFSDIGVQMDGYPTINPGTERQGGGKPPVAYVRFFLLQVEE